MKDFLIAIGIVAVLFIVGYIITLHADYKVENKEIPQDYDESLF